MNPDAVLLEWEGVLVDTAAARRDALLAALDAEGVHLTAAEHDRHCAGLGVVAAAHAALSAAGHRDAVLADLVTLRAERAFAETLGQGFVLREGALALVTQLQAACPVAVVSHAGRAETELVLRLSGMLELVAIAVCDGERDGDDLWISALERLSRRRTMQASRCVALCGLGASIGAARAAGLRAVAVGLPAHVAMQAQASLDDLTALTPAKLAELAGVSSGRLSA